MSQPSHQAPRPATLGGLLSALTAALLAADMTPLRHALEALAAPGER